MSGLSEVRYRAAACFSVYKFRKQLWRWKSGRWKVNEWRRRVDSSSCGLPVRNHLLALISILVCVDIWNLAQSHATNALNSWYPRKEWLAGPLYQKLYKFSFFSEKQRDKEAFGETSPKCWLPLQMPKIASIGPAWSWGPRIQPRSSTIVAGTQVFEP